MATARVVLTCPTKGLLGSEDDEAADNALDEASRR